MKRIVLILIITFSLGLVIESNAQSKKELKQQEKAEKKAAKYKKDSIAIFNLKVLVLTQAFVLEANTLFARTGQSYILSPSINFVGFDGKNSTIQLAFDQLVGWNGIGGVTLDGYISDMEIEDNKKGLGFTINATVMQKAKGTVTMIFRVSTDGTARVDMSGAFGENLSFQGRIVSLAETRVYKGTALY